MQINIHKNIKIESASIHSTNALIFINYYIWTPRSDTTRISQRGGSEHKIFYHSITNTTKLEKYRNILKFQSILIILYNKSLKIVFDFQ